MKESFELKPNTTLEDPLTGQKTKFSQPRTSPQTELSPPAQTLHKGFTLKTEDLLDEPATESHPASTIYEPQDEELSPKPRFFSNPLLWLLLLILSLGGLEAYSLLKEIFASDNTLGMVISSALFLILVLFTCSCLKEIRVLLKFKQIDEHKAEVIGALKSGSFKEAVRVCHTLAKDSGFISKPAFTDFAQMLQPHFTPAEVFALYERMILKEQDCLAKEIIIKRSRENGLIVALSPLAWVDMTLTLARSLRMIRELSEIYGLRLSFLGRLQLYKRVLRNLVLIGITELATDAVIDVIGAGAAAKMNAALGQGLAAGIYSTRLGYMTMKAIRPFNISPQVLTLGQLRKELLSSGELRRLLEQHRK